MEAVNLKLDQFLGEMSPDKLDNLIMNMHTPLGLPTPHQTKQPY